MTASTARRNAPPLRAPWRTLALAIALGASLVAARAAAPVFVPESGEIDRATARALVDALIQDVETQALPPRVQAEYDRAKLALVALLETRPPTLDRHVLYDAARTMLSTLDSDGHTLLWSKQQAATWAASTTPGAAAAPTVVRTLPAPGGGTVLVLRPPQTTFADAPSTRQYVAAMTAQVNRALEGSPAPCALVIDLGDQAGGSAWPGIAGLASLITPANTARLVDREGRRRPLVPQGAPEYFTGAALPPSALSRFAGRPFAVALNGQTASAGEMLAIALRGEPGVRTFGRPTYGLTTANLPTELPDGATVLLTIARYAYGSEPPLRGPLQPDTLAATSLTPDATLKLAADWAAQTCAR